MNLINIIYRINIKDVIYWFITSWISYHAKILKVVQFILYPYFIK